MTLQPRCQSSLLLIFLAPFILIIASSTLWAQDELPNQKNGRFERLSEMLEGIPIGADSRLFPYASIEDWFDPYGGLKIEHPVFWSQQDRLVQHAKFETIRDYSWKFRYVANSLSNENLLLSLLFKLKYDRDAYFYGIGNGTIRSNRLGATYGSVFFGVELKTLLSERVALRWSPGFWTFQSGLKEGGEFERPANAQLITSRITLATPWEVDYLAKKVEHSTSGYVELAVAANEGPSSYARFNIETLTRIPLFGNLKLSFGSRAEYAISPNRTNIPYFALPETGSRSGLRAYSKERFRNFALHVYNLELVQGLSKQFELFLLSDFAQTGSNPAALLDNRVHPSVGAGLRFINKNSPVSAGIARGKDGWKIFSTINAALSF